METCMRGFSFMPEAKVDVIDLQDFIEIDFTKSNVPVEKHRHDAEEVDNMQDIWSECQEYPAEYDRDESSSRRLQVEQQAEETRHDTLDQQKMTTRAPGRPKILRTGSVGRPKKIYQTRKVERSVTSTDANEVEDFAGSTEITLKNALKNDPYQFLEQLPEPLLKELMETELQKMQKENAELKISAREGDEENVMFHIFDDEKDDEKDEVSGAEVEVLNDSLCSPCTVREKPNEEFSEDQMSNSLIHTATIDKESSTKSTENVSNVIESSIYCAKVKDLRMKIDEQMLTILTWLERRDVLNAEAEDVLRMCKRSAEFSNRFNRIYMYQLHRQMHDLKRHSTNVLPFAKHTQFQSQMVRVVSLHQNMYQAYQVLYKSLEQTSCLRESADCLRCLVQVTRDAAALCRSAPTPKDFAAAANLYNDAVLVSCDKLDEVLNEYSTRMAELLNTTGHNSTSTSHKSKSSGKKRSLRKWKNSNIKSGTEADARLSMYSLETLRSNLNTKLTNSKDNQSSGTSKVRGNLNSVYSIRKKNPEKNEQAPKSHGKSPRCRRPLMRDPHAGKPRAPKSLKETDIRTMVEAVETCTSSHMSREVSPRGSPKEQTPRRRNKEITPRNKPDETTQRKSQTSTPRPRVRLRSPAKTGKIRQSSPTLKPALSSVRSDSNNTECSQMPITPISKVQCAKKGVRKDSPQSRSKERPEEPKAESAKPSPRLERVAVVTGNIEKKVEREDEKQPINVALLGSGFPL
ncbi:hypothetical protein K1T71_008049 [Dendrolimus kikuchii]|uniref:Uncharacterized protein n=1 Tax=Dendrolimus kikuchii TaxID=765133 RepID=A0ACC1CZF6_9NEOP|nr:hypothetical protein K1T71_008049 [Dendrolimus kikuchii]